MTHRMPEEQLFKLLGGVKSKKKESQEERTPRQIAEEHAYTRKDGTFLVPSTMISGALRHVAGDYKQTNSSKKSLKPLISAVVRPESEYLELLDENYKLVKDFEVDIRQGRNALKGAIAVVRPRWDRWSLEFTLVIDDSIVPTELVQDMLADAGKRSGIGSFRVSNSGFFGQFQIAEWKPLK
jgi:hypothetical protein